MVNVCKGICNKFKAIGFKGRHRYEKGQKLCPICSEFLEYPGVRCPCCSVKRGMMRSIKKSQKI